jgi:hypothetical protein
MTFFTKVVQFIYTLRPFRIFEGQATEVLQRSTAPPPPDTDTIRRTKACAAPTTGTQLVYTEEIAGQLRCMANFRG